MKKVLIDLKEIVKTFDGQTIVNHLNLQIYENEFLTLLGPSGCGKTTTLRMIAGFEKPEAGVIIIDGKIVNDLPPYARPVNTVFQRYALFPHLNVIENIVFGLKNSSYASKLMFYGEDNLIKEAQDKYPNKKITKHLLNKLINEKIYQDAEYAIKLVNLQGLEYRKINQLSGGQMQRVALARAIINRPKILLLDEPLAALDLKLRQNMHYELKEMQRRLGITFIFVTHDQEEAMTMSDRIVVINDGVIQQLGTPKEIYNEPVNRFVADFIGESNIIRGKYIKENEIEVLNKRIPCVGYKFAENEIVDVVIRPEDWDVVSLDKAVFVGKVISSIFKGVHYEIIAKVEDVELIIHTYEEVKVNDQIGLKVDPYEIHLMRVAQDE